MWPGGKKVEYPCSIRMRSGDITGQSILRISSPFRNSSTRCSTCLALSSIKAVFGKKMFQILVLFFNINLRHSKNERIPIAHSNHSASCKDIEACAAIQRVACPDHQASSAVMVDFSDIARQVARPWISPYVASFFLSTLRSTPHQKFSRNVWLLLISKPKDECPRCCLSFHISLVILTIDMGRYSVL
ncbi:hypothetical protein TNCV_3338631 [Trichonephila clavipes]|nr:hypothetical protein TNCV_3338631 [Trichonephila clavipes]